MNTHQFKPQIPKTAKKLLIGTLPPEEVTFYFSNSSNTRLWDILTAINNKVNTVGSGGNNLSNKEVEGTVMVNLQTRLLDVVDFKEYE